MTVNAIVSLPLPEPVELPSRFGHLTRMRATYVEVRTSATLSGISIHTTLRGPGVKKDGSDAVKPSFVWLSEKDRDGRPLLGERYYLIPDADWAVIRRAQGMVQAMLDAAREVEEAAA